MGADPRPLTSVTASLSSASEMALATAEVKEPSCPRDRALANARACWKQRGSNAAVQVHNSRDSLSSAVQVNYLEGHSGCTRLLPGVEPE